jgi:hypothetical protein
VVECAGLENRSGFTPIEGSNPSASVFIFLVGKLKRHSSEAASRVHAHNLKTWRMPKPLA